MSEPPRSANVTWHAGTLDREGRWAALGQSGVTLWFTGLPSSGKSSIAVAAEDRLVRDGRMAYRLDGDNVRHGLNGDLGFGASERAENVRRVAHVAALFADAGAVTFVSLVSPYAADRALARRVHSEQGLPFLEVWVSTPLEECERRDPKGLYARARAGEIQGFTGVNDPYEAPTDPDLELPAELTLEQAVEAVLARLP